MSNPEPITFRLLGWAGQDDGLVTWDPAHRQLRGTGFGPDLLRSRMAKALRDGELDTPAGPIKVADPYADPGGLADCVVQHFKLPPELAPFVVRREPFQPPDPSLQILY